MTEGPIQERVLAFVRARGERGVAPAEVAAAFLFPTGAQPAMAEKLAEGILSADARLKRRADGLWVAAAPVSAAPAAFTVIETVAAEYGGRFLDLECSAIRVEADGRPTGARGAAVRPDPWPPGLILPPALAAKVRAAGTIQDLLPKVAEFARGATLTAWRIGGLHTAVARLNEETGGGILSLRRLARRFIEPRLDSAADLAARLGLAAREPATASERARYTAEILCALLTRRAELGLPPPSEWAAEQHAPREEVDFAGRQFDRGFLDTLPDRPGVYVMRDAAGAVVYVGKAQNLRERVGSYFRPRTQRDEKTARILEEAARIDVEETGSDLGAWLTEFERIRALAPTINTQFDVHARPAAARAPRRRIIVVAPAPDPAQAELFLLHGDRALRRLLVARNAPAAAREAIGAFFFSGAPPAEGAQNAELLQLAWSWIERRADDVSAFDVDLAGGMEAAVLLLEKYLRETSEEGRVFHT